MRPLANNPAEVVQLAGLRTALRGFAAERLTRPMVPTRFVMVASLPKLPNGKVDRGRLPGAETLDSEYPLPSHVDIETPAHAAAADLWAQLLGVEGLCVDDDFFDLGGSSLLVVEMAARWTAYSGTVFDLAPFLRRPTIRHLVDLTVTDGHVKETEESGRYTELPTDIEPAGQPAPWPPGAALVTGGVVAVSVVQELLDHGVPIVHIVASAPDAGTALRGFAEAMHQQGLPQPADLERILVTPGDLTRPYLGMAMRDYRRLARQVDLVVHTHIEHGPVNALTAQEVLRFAVTDQLKPVQYAPGAVPDRYVRQAAGRGIPLSVYRRPVASQRRHRLNGDYVTTDHVLSVPLDHHNPAGPMIEIVAQEVVAAGREHEDLPYLLFLQGGPGGRSPTPGKAASAWIDGALATHRVILLDQRGAGRSSPLTNEYLSCRSDEEIVALVHQHRADAIVADAELLRNQLIGDHPWTLLGQSYGGFIALTYLSRAPDGVAGAIISGGLPNLDTSLDDWFTAQVQGMLEKNAEYYERYPDDVQRVASLIDHLEAKDVRLPDGSRLTGRRLRRLGLHFGMSDGYERTHALITKGWDGQRITDQFKQTILAETGFAAGPLYALQEFVYAEPGRATQWTANRVVHAFPEYEKRPVKFYGEFMFPWMLQEITHLRPFAKVADLLAKDTSFAEPYDRDRLANNIVPVLAVAYQGDVYAPLEAQRRTAALVGNCRLVVSTEHHNSLMRSRTMMAKLLSELRSVGGTDAGSHRLPRHGHCRNLSTDRASAAVGGVDGPDHDRPRGGLTGGRGADR